jgi:lysozyme
MKTSEDGKQKLMKREGVRQRAYLDTKGIPTIGVGHTGPEVYMGLVWTMQQVEDAFADDIQWAEDAVNRYVTVPLEQHQFDALVSFVFNIGETQFRRSTLLKTLNTGDYAEAAICFDMWHKPKEIIGRRDSEREQFRGPPRNT